MTRIIYAPVFIKQLKKLNKDLQQEVIEKVELFKNEANHNSLKVHKLHGKFKDCYSFSVNYRFRIVFMYISAEEVAFMTIGDHDVYK